MLYSDRVIREFRDDYYFLSNFYPCYMIFDGFIWKSSEAAYQGMKFLDRTVRGEFAFMTPGKAKREARARTDIREDWDQVRTAIMYDILMAKFSQNPDLAKRLIDTGEALLEEGNTWNDTFWGICPVGSGKGKNMLGILLMNVRQNLQYPITQTLHRYSNPL